MLHRTLKSAEGELNITVPSEPREVTLRQMTEILKLKDVSNLKLLEILSGVSEKSWRNCKDLDGFNGLVVDLKGILDTPSIPKVFHIGEEAVSIPEDSDVGDATIGQFEDVKETVTGLLNTDKEGNYRAPTELEIAEAAPLLVATYVQPLIDGEYDYKKARKLSKQIPDCSAMEVFALTNFFLYSTLSYLTGIPKTQLLSALPQKKERQASRGFLKTLALWLRSIPSHRGV